jgi:dephospho-CoA kinase
MFLIALTGGIGSGKTTVAEFLKQLGAYEIDADQIAKEVVEVGTEGLAAVAKEFGQGIIEDSGQLNRGRLAKIVFEDESKRIALEGILHPLIKRRTKELLESTKQDIVVYSVPLLVEAEVDHNFDLIITVESDPESQIERLVANRNMSAQEALRRIGAQATSQERRSRADIVIENSGTIADLENIVKETWQKVLIMAEAKRQGLGNN